MGLEDNPVSGTFGPINAPQGPQGSGAAYARRTRKLSAKADGRKQHGSATKHHQNKKKEIKI